MKNWCDGAGGRGAGREESKDWIRFDYDLHAHLMKFIFHTSNENRSIDFHVKMLIPLRSQ